MDNEQRKKRLLYRANHRGIKEMDIILGRYADVHISRMDEAGLDAFEALMAESDRDLLNWFTSESECPKRIDTPLFNSILQFCQTKNKNRNTGQP